MSEARPPFPPFTEETALPKVQAAEDAWNTRDPERVALAYTEDSVWRNRDKFVTGRAEIVEFLTAKWERELDYALRKSLWAFTDDRIAVRFQYESHDATGQWLRSYGNELWEFDDEGLMRRREASINDLPIAETTAGSSGRGRSPSAGSSSRWAERGQSAAAAAVARSVSVRLRSVVSGAQRYVTTRPIAQTPAAISIDGPIPSLSIPTGSRNVPACRADPAASRPRTRRRCRAARTGRSRPGRRRSGRPQIALKNAKPAKRGDAGSRRRPARSRRRSAAVVATITQNEVSSSGRRPDPLDHRASRRARRGTRPCSWR